MKMDATRASLAEAIKELDDASAKLHAAVNAHADAEKAMEKATEVYSAARDKANEAVAAIHLQANKVGE